MREIKFRAWDNGENKWLLGYEYKNLGGFSLFGEVVLLGGWSRVLDDYLFGRDGHSAEDLVVMQFTGLKDKNGKEIYEGDIVKGVVKFPQLTTFDTDENSNYKMCGKVYYDHSGFSLKCIQALCQKDRYGMVNYFDFISGDGEIFDEMEIIGNEFENPELLK